MSEDNLTEVKSEGQPAFPVEDQGNDNPSDSSPDNTSDDQTQSDEGSNSDEDNKDNKSKKGDAGFAKHPRWKEREDDWTERFNDQEKRHTDELAKLREEFEDKIEAAKPKESSKIPSWFGGDENQWAEYQNDVQSRIDKAKEEARTEALNSMNSKTEAEQKAIDEATKYFKSEVSEIESDKTLNPDGAKVDQNKLLKFVLDNDLVDSKGRWNYRAGWQLMQSKSKTTQNKKLEEKKKIANATTDDTHTEDKPKDYATSEDFQNPQNRPW